MGTRTTREPRTLLELLIWQRDRTYDEIAADFDVFARNLSERATLSSRHLRRLASGERAGTTPVTRRVLASMFSRSVDELLASPVSTSHGDITPTTPGIPLVSSSALVPPGMERQVLDVAAERAKRFGRLAGTNSLTAETMEQVYDDVRELALAYPQQPLPTILPRLVEAQDQVFTLLEGRERPEHMRQLYFLSGVIGGLLAKASHDLANPHAALTQARTAFLCADQADHHGLRAWIRGLQSLVSYWAGRPNESIRYAQSGAEFAVAAGSTTSVWLPVSEARAWAALGHASQVQEAIERAERAWDSVQPDDLDELGGICTFTRPRQLYYTADALAWLPTEVEAAERYSQDAVDAYSDPTAPEWAFSDQAGSHADLAIARIGRGEVEGAIEAIEPVLGLAPEHRINGIIHSTQRVHKALSGAELGGQGRDLQEAIEAFTSVPMNALPR